MPGQIDIKDKISSFVNDYFVKDTGILVRYDTSFLDEGIIDSTGVMELVAYIELTFKIKIEDEEIIPDNIDSINKIVNFVQAKLKDKT